LMCATIRQAPPRSVDLRVLEVRLLDDTRQPLVVIQWASHGIEKTPNPPSHPPATRTVSAGNGPSRGYPSPCHPRDRRAINAPAPRSPRSRLPPREGSGPQRRAIAWAGIAHQRAKPSRRPEWWPTRAASRGNGVRFTALAASGWCRAATAARPAVKQHHPRARPRNALRFGARKLSVASKPHAGVRFDTLLVHRCGDDWRRTRRSGAPATAAPLSSSWRARRAQR